MIAQTYKKMAGTSAVFLSASFNKASPVERDGLVWTAQELQLEKLAVEYQEKAPMQNALALEGLEEYDMPHNGDIRKVESINAEFVYFELLHAWIQIAR
ncbi:MAG: hypothetical protein COA96_08285 [SAR86 cluster bacterium]|uniref:Uncharacterized protein n=1 Tax=SAR86 cluster bacterium TaxID=2030880 RepID=A0A2A5B0H0_9GAMM|nr:MAG: hypothetical protein COA96_08285 [SAR86 cluster bacterium]